MKITSKTIFGIVLFSSLYLICLNAAMAEDLREQTLPEQIIQTEEEVSVEIPGNLREYYSRIVIREILTENDCKYLIDLNQSLSLVEKAIKENKLDRAKELLQIIFVDADKIKSEASKRIDERLRLGETTRDFKILFSEVKKRRYPYNCAYHHLQDIENDAKLYQKDVDKIIFKHEAKLIDREREEKMRSHIEKALSLLEEKKYHEGKLELKMALELCRDFQTEKVIKQRIRETDAAINQEKRDLARQKRIRK